ncbi:LacI family DNA-binding transcriptional regulator [Streptomyces sp. NPDC047108]|uniref:LacI family DNA-binding transcriptional regulator n=1 Tax=Streptomyces sp. NPDC047108 TaxID=3155025 RepID=UPI0033DF8E7E
MPRVERSDAGGVRASIADVARAAGVSTASVSRSLRGLGGVSEGTRARVVQVARELGYAISPGAASLRSGRTRSIAVVTPYIDRWFFGRALGAFESVLQQADLHVMLHSLHGSAEARRRLFAERILHRRVDAVLIMCLKLEQHEIDALEALDVPVALLGSRAGDFSSVAIDDFAAAHDAVSHLTGLGHRRIGLIGGSPADPLRFTAPMERRAGYRDALKSAGVANDRELEADADYTIGGGERAMTRLLALERRPTAVFAESDEMAFGALRALREARVKVPDDLSIIGIDDHDMSHLVDLTTVAQPVAEQGAAAAHALLAALEDRSRPPSRLTEPTRLVVRGTTTTPQDA